MHANANDAPRRQAALIFVFVTVALDMIALGMIAPVFVPLVEQFLHVDVRRAAGVVGVFGTVFALMQFGWPRFWACRPIVSGAIVPLLPDPDVVGDADVVAHPSTSSG